MRHYIVTLLLLSGLVGIANAQIGNFNEAQIPDHTPMMNSTWEAIDKMMYKVTTEGNKKVYTPAYPEPLKKLENTVVELPGYMVPLKSGRHHDTYMLSVLPITQCQFCGTNGIPPMVEIFMKKGTVKFTDEPIKIKGKMVFNPEPLKGNAEIQIVNAELMN
ncbi:MAG TPA: hypothetical protein H9825_06465 [Candidatus Sphingobacterium stercorigallinarum]|nr:hypothetical protein [Candidatus Sphingobacterium stercorigallinarum]